MKRDLIARSEEKIGKIWDAEDHQSVIDSLAAMRVVRGATKRGE